MLALLHCLDVTWMYLNVYREDQKDKITVLITNITYELLLPPVDNLLLDLDTVALVGGGRSLCIPFGRLMRRHQLQKRVTCLHF